MATATAVVSRALAAVLMERSAVSTPPSMSVLTFLHHSLPAPVHLRLQGRFLAFAGPHDVRTTTPEGYHTTAVDDVIPYFRARGISAVIRLNKRYYNERRFMAAGIDHHDMYYLDGSNPPEPILQRFLATCEQTPGAIAVHW